MGNLFWELRRAKQEMFKINDLHLGAKTLCIVFGAVFMPFLWLECHGLTALPYMQLTGMAAPHVAGLVIAPLVGLDLHWHEAQVRRLR
jgi:hypothetical protein